MGCRVVRAWSISGNRSGDSRRSTQGARELTWTGTTQADAFSVRGRRPDGVEDRGDDEDGWQHGSGGSDAGHGAPESQFDFGDRGHRCWPGPVG